jgi:hypothetical protein
MSKRPAPDSGASSSSSPPLKRQKNGVASYSTVVSVDEMAARNLLLEDEVARLQDEVARLQERLQLQEEESETLPTAVTNNISVGSAKKKKKSNVQNIVKKKNSLIMRRKYDTAKHSVLTLLKTQVEKNNVIFDKEASDKKKEIFGDDWENTCIWTGETNELSVDHIYPIRGAYGNKNKIKTGWLKNGLRGSDSQWNTIMVYKTRNAGFKIFNHTKTHGWKRDISFQHLTSEELNQCTQQERDLYVKIQRWRNYAKKRGASFCWQFEEETNIKIEQIYTDTYKLLEERISNLDVKLVSPSRVHERLARERAAPVVNVSAAPVVNVSAAPVVNVSAAPVADLQKKAQQITSYFKPAPKKKTSSTKRPTTPMSPAQKATLEDWYEKYVERVEGRIIAKAPWDSYKAYCKEAGISPKKSVTTKHAGKGHQKKFLSDEKNHKHVAGLSSGKSWFYNLKLK